MAQRSEETRVRMNRMAELLASGKCENASEAGRIMGLTKGEAARLWHSMRMDLGLRQCV